MTALLFATAAATPANACGCGVIAPAPGAVVDVVSEEVLVTWDNGLQSIDLSLGVDSDVAQAGLIIPTPSPATVTPGDTELIATVAVAGAPRERYIDDWWGTGADDVDEEPTVVSRVQVGGLEAVTLESDDSAGLGIWLLQHGYELPATTAGLFDQYIAKGWYFTAIKLAATPETAVLAGQLDPVRISFATDSLVFPMGLSRAAVTGESLRVSVVWDHRAQLVQAGTSGQPLNAAQRTVFAGATSGALADVGAYLTVVDLRFDAPSAQVTGDIGIVAAANDAEVSESVLVHRPIELLGFPLGTLLAVWGGLGLLVLLGAVIARSRLR